MHYDSFTAIANFASQPDAENTWYISLARTSTAKRQEVPRQVVLLKKLECPSSFLGNC